MTFNQRRLTVITKLQEITTYLKSSNSQQMKEILLENLETKSVMNVEVPSTQIPKLRNCSYDYSVIPKRQREKRLRIKLEKEAAKKNIQQ